MTSRSIRSKETLREQESKGNVGASEMQRPILIASKIYTEPEKQNLNDKKFLDTETYYLKDVSGLNYNRTSEEMKKN